MKHSDAEIIFGKALYISFGVGVHPDSEGNDLLGSISFGFNNDDIYDAVDLYKYLSESYKESEKEIKITNLTDNFVGVDLTINSSPISIFHIEKIRCSTMEYNLDWFKKKEIGRKLFLHFRHNQQLTSLEGTAIFMGIGSQLSQMEPILIHFWKG